MANRRRGFGRIARLPSGRHRAAYIGPDLVKHKAPETFANREDAEGWLGAVKRRIDLGTWTAPDAAPVARKRP
ncbi:hypothetical protein M3149_22760, partial [Hydrogenophaga intermedia]